jgi:hypothetical protein
MRAIWSLISSILGLLFISTIITLSPFFAGSSLCHYLEAAPVDTSGYIAWGLSGTTVGGTGTAIGTGWANTAAILAADADAPAAKACADYSSNSLDDWFLPSKDKLNVLYQNKTAISGLGTSYYWSSTEYDSNDAWIQRFSDGYQANVGKTYSDCVRAVRAF